MSTPCPVSPDLQNSSQPSASIGDLSLPLFQSKGWMKFVGVMFIIHGVLMGFVAIGFTGYIFTNDIIGEIGSARGLNIIPGIDAILFALLFLVGTLLLIWTGALVLRAAGAIGRARQNGDVATLKEGLGKLKKLFVITGIIYPFILILSILTPLISVAIIVLGSMGCCHGDPG